MSFLEIDGITAGYGGITVIRDVSITCERGELALILGPNGAGKTTLLRAISGMCDRRAGTVRVDGEDLTGRSTAELARLGLVHVAEGRQLFPQMTVAENLDLGCQRRDLRARLGERLDYVFDLFPVLSQRRRQQAGTMSGGEQQMLAIGRALMADPRVVLLDEPSTGLAPGVFAEVVASLRRIVSDGGCVALVEQVLPPDLPPDGRGFILGDGALTFSAPLAELLAMDDLWEVYLGMSRREH
ncbi:ABC transporter ATP-binding protein [Pseudonocardia ailaonensis]|uniref:ABC transporter ATP-binding protein n=1 Tax=Pseudonocardia ailaonensis TaxID=367279 RepID=A0ABN2N5E4_9PSEU